MRILTEEINFEVVKMFWEINILTTSKFLSGKVSICPFQWVQNLEDISFSFFHKTTSLKVLFPVR